eukprot:COSAG04_NODE_18582_length_437_cov_11.449704_1_plen_91_part_10
MKGCVSRLTPLVVDRNASLRKLSAKSCATNHSHSSSDADGVLRPAWTNVDVVLTACCVDRLAALHRINTPNFLGAMVSLPLSQQTNAKKSM